VAGYVSLIIMSHAANMAKWDDDEQVAALAGVRIAFACQSRKHTAANRDSLHDDAALSGPMV
jgi:hypothetical protein